MWNNKDFCGIVMSSGDTKVLGFNQYEKSDKTQSIFYVDLESLKDSATKLGERVFFPMDIWWYRKQAWCIQRWRLHEKVL